MLLIVYGSEGFIYFNGEVLLNVLRCQLTYLGQVVTSAEARFSKCRPVVTVHFVKPEATVPDS